VMHQSMLILTYRSDNCTISDDITSMVLGLILLMMVVSNLAFVFVGTKIFAATYESSMIKQKQDSGVGKTVDHETVRRKDLHHRYHV
jgi:hypothetical protein